MWTGRGGSLHRNVDRKRRVLTQEPGSAVLYEWMWTGRGGYLYKDVERKVWFSEDDSRVMRVKMTHVE